MVRLGEVLTRSAETTVISPEAEYREITVKLRGKGVVLRGLTSGARLAGSRRFWAKTDNFILSRIDARNGATGIIPPELDGAVVSNDFPLLCLDDDRVDPVFLGWLTKTENFVELCRHASEGTTNRVRLKEERFLSLEIPLPSLAEQRRMVVRIEELATKIAEARSLREKAVEAAETLAVSEGRALLNSMDIKPTSLGSMLAPDREGIQTGPFGAQLSSEEFTEKGVPVLTIGNVQYSGLDTRKLKFVAPEKAGELSRYCVQEGDVLFARMGTVGRCCVVPKNADGWLINYHIIRVALDSNHIDPRFLHWTIRSSSDIETYLQSKIRGATREGVNSKIVSGLPCRVPSLAEQRCIVAYLDGLQTKVDALKRLQTETAAELYAMLPAILDRAFKGELC
jgi:type I restriction enzyme S subunit